MRYFAVFGDPIAHSLSPRLHNLALQGYGIDGFYSRVHLKDGSKLVEIFNKLHLSGANITIPHKQTALKLCDKIDEIAKNIGSINTLVLKDGKISGFNTDAPGFMMAIRDFGEIKTALIIGAGGTARALSYILTKNGIDTEIINRSDKSSQFLSLNFFTPQNFTPKSYDLVINTTPAGLVDDNLPIDEKILREIFEEAKFAFDAIYGRQTPFLRAAAARNLAAKDGADMLLYQAVLAFNLFFDGKLDNEMTANFMRKAFIL